MTSFSSSRVLKANDVRGHGGRIAFNYEDLQKRCDEYIEKVQAEARRILEEAHVAAEELRRKGAAEGREEGRRAGMKDAEQTIAERAGKLTDERLAERLGSILPALETLSQEMAVQKDRWLGEWEATAVQMCVGIAGRLLRRRLAAEPDLARELIAPALELAVGNSQVSVRLNPLDLELLGPQAAEVVRSLSACSDAQLVPDPAILRGGCLVETQHGRIDARLETQLERISEELLPGIE